MTLAAIGYQPYQRIFVVLRLWKNWDWVGISYLHCQILLDTYPNFRFWGQITTIFLSFLNLLRIYSLWKPCSSTTINYHRCLIQWGVVIYNNQNFFQKTPDQLDQCIKTCHWSLILDLHTTTSSEEIIIGVQIQDQWSMASFDIKLVWCFGKKFGCYELTHPTVRIAWLYSSCDM